MSNIYSVSNRVNLNFHFENIWKNPHKTFLSLNETIALYDLYTILMINVLLSFENIWKMSNRTVLLYTITINNVYIIPYREAIYSNTFLIGVFQMFTNEISCHYYFSNENSDALM